MEKLNPLSNHITINVIINQNMSMIIGSNNNKVIRENNAQILVDFYFKACTFDQFKNQ